MEVIRGEYQDGTYLITTVSPLWPPSPRPPSGSCQSSWTSPRPPCPRRSPYSPWLRSQGRTDHSHAQANKKGLWCQPMPTNKDGAAPLGNPALPCGLIKQLIVEFARTHTHTKKTVFPGHFRAQRWSQSIGSVDVGLLPLAHVGRLRALCPASIHTLVSSAWWGAAAVLQASRAPQVSCERF